MLARRLAERGVRFTQVFLRGWDQDKNLPKQLPDMGKAVRCLIDYARENPDKQADIFGEVHCQDC